ncbi:hypothetical protein WG66_002273 [Moniliophthora roreri]|nr:hypothetical protein WG66_002273 [Moniliophthora roreri]
MSSPFRFRRRNRVGVQNISITNIHQQVPLDIKPPSSRALSPATPVSISGTIAETSAQKSTLNPVLAPQDRYLSFEMHMSQRIKEIVVETVLLGLFNPSFALFFLALWDWSRWSNKFLSYFETEKLGNWCLRRSYTVPGLSGAESTVYTMWEGTMQVMNVDVYPPN